MYYHKYIIAESLSQAIRLMEEDGDARLIAGGTDVMVELRHNHREPPALIDISRIPELSGIKVVGSQVIIGAAVTYTTLIESTKIQREAPLLIDACRQIGATQIQHMGTIGGNIANASPAGDMLPALYVLDARIHIFGPKGERQEPITQFITGVRKTSLKPAEIITAISFERPSSETGSAFLKFGLREAQAISVASVAVLLQITKGKIRSARIALGAVAPTIIRSCTAEVFLQEHDPSTNTFTQAAEIAQVDSRPIDDIRGRASFRRYLIKPLVKECLEIACHRASE